MSFEVIDGGKSPEPERTDGLFGVDRDTYAWWTQPRVTQAPIDMDAVRRQLGRLFWRVHGPRVIDGGKP